jgi:cell division protein FtsQ
VFALAGKKQQKRTYTAADVDVQETRVLPRFLRKPMRMLTRLKAGNVTIPRHSGILATFILFLSTGVYGTVIGGHTADVTEAVTSRVGFAITEVNVSGHRETSEIDVLGELGLDGSTSLIGFDTDAARERLIALPWVASAEITKVYPNSLNVKIGERKAFAIWQHDEELSLIEEDGHVIVPFAHPEFSTLPLVTGVGAEREAKLLVPAVAAIPELKSRVKAQMLIAGRRWDVRLDNGVTIQLPEGDPADALSKLAEVDSATGLLSKDIELVDMRLPDRMVVRLTQEAMVVRDEEVKALNDKAKKAGKHT